MSDRTFNHRRQLEPRWGGAELQQRAAGGPARQNEVSLGSLEKLLNTLAEPWATEGRLRQQTQKIVAAYQTVTEERQHYRTLFDLAPTAYLIIDAKAVIQEANHAAAELLDMSPEALVDKPLSAFVMAGEHKTLQARLRRLWNLQRAESWAVRLRRQGGRPFPVLMTLATAYSPRGELQGLCMLLRDSTTRKQAEMVLRENGETYRSLLWQAQDGTSLGSQSLVRNGSPGQRAEEALQQTRDDLESQAAEHTAALHRVNAQLQAEILAHQQTKAALRKSEERFRNLMTGSIQGVLIYRGNHQPLFANQAYAALFGYDTPDDILRLDTVLPLIAPQERDRLERYCDARLTGQCTPTPYEYQGVRKDGALIWLENTVTVVDWEGEPAIQSTVADISGRKRAEQALQSSRQQLWKLARRLQERQEAERRHIAREIHDELGQIVTSLKMDVAWLAKRIVAAPTLCQDRLTIMTAQLDTLIDTIHRIGTALRPTVLDDLGLAAAIEHQLQDVQRRTGMAYTLALPPEEVVIEPARATALFRIFQEAVTNVVRHAEASAVAVRVAQEPDALRLEVCDNGKGITPEQLIHNHSLGLLSMRERAELWGGTVTVQGEPGAGTTVTVSLPYGPIQIRGASS